MLAVEAANHLRGRTNDSHLIGPFASLGTARGILVRLLALCRESSVALVTPFCEGVSLAAKDFVAAQEPDDPGVLNLSTLISSDLWCDGALIPGPQAGLAERHCRIEGGGR